ncbi:metal ABC transporter ATP-binding protein, partial [Peptoniphilus sp.]|uniref:metal ABC transporter ATP-binding protein n=1 Tax=Peptoniphilus sp. TaxID=1971214 RepID=UPI003D8B4621
SYDVNFSDIGYVPQIDASTNLQFPITVFELVSLALFSKDKRGFNRINKADRDKVMQALQIVKMQDYSKNLYSELSGGQRQRVLIAKTLVSTPKFLVLDEPMTGIDKESRQSLLKLLEHINKSHNITILMITHDLAEVRENVTKIYTVADHKIREVNS